MARTRHNRATDSVLDSHVERLQQADAVLSWTNDEVRRARAARDEAIRDAVAAGLSLRQIGGALGLSAQGVNSTLPGSKPVYDTIGTTYTRTRQPDPRVRDAIWAGLAGARTVVNVGAGAGSYEPPQTLLAVEPSMVMIAQRPAGLAPAAVTTADRIPLPDKSVDAALAVLTIHHWSELEAGLAEMRRVARRAVILTWDMEAAREFWLLRDYLPALTRADEQRSIPIDWLCETLGGNTRVVPVLIPHDCTDGFQAAFWRRPEAYLDPLVRAGISTFSLVEESDIAEGLERLLDDLRTGTWHEKYAALLEQDEADMAYRLVIAEWD